ncbi:MAG: hypothetical protein RL660_2803 [Bacteroidota bacterium]|jgi:hypothetical protein
MQEQYPIKTAIENGTQYIYCGIRKRFLQATPEEIIRQQTIQFLVEECCYPKGSINVEKAITSGGKRIRYDIAVFYENEAWMIVECKQSNVALNADTFFQSTAYYAVLKPKYILLNNGDQMVCYDTQQLKWLDELPRWGT